MTLQALAFPDPTDDPLLFFRGNGMLISEKRVLSLSAGNEISTDTFYNEFDVDTWRSRCALKGIRLVITFTGHVRLSLYSSEADRQPNHLYSLELESEKQASYSLRIEDSWSGRLHCRIGVLEERPGAEIFGIEYAAGVLEKSDRIGVVMCTYRREMKALANVHRIVNEILENPHSRIGNRLQLVVVDNGRTLPPSTHPSVVLLPNPNTGGTGGFMRGLQYFQAMESPPEHIVFMDDDASINTESVERTWSHLSLLREEYRGMILAGGMLREDNPSILHESVAGWTGLRLRNGKTGLNLGIADQLDAYHEDLAYSRPYSAWWYCAFTPEAWDSMPLVPPFFIKGDDVFFSLANPIGVFSLNGIVVKHEAFDLKYAPEFNRYFALRNLMAVNTRYLGFRAKAANILSVILRVMAEVAVYNYRSASLCLKALEDYMKGPEYLLEAIQEDVLNGLKKDRETLLPVDRPFIRRWDEDRLIPRLRAFLKMAARIVTFSGHLYPKGLLRGETAITLGYTNLSLVPVFCSAYYAVSKDNRFYVYRKRAAGLGLFRILQALTLSIKYLFSGVDHRWRRFFHDWNGNKAAGYWKMTNRNSLKVHEGVSSTKEVGTYV